MSIAILLQQILIIFLEIGTGAAVTKLGIMDDRNSKFLSNLVMSVTLPCTLLASASIDGGREAVAGMLKGHVVLEIFYILTIGICLVLSRAMHLTRARRPCWWVPPSCPTAPSSASHSSAPCWAARRVPCMVPPASWPTTSCSLLMYSTCSTRKPR